MKKSMAADLQRSGHAAYQAVDCPPTERLEVFGQPQSHDLRKSEIKLNELGEHENIDAQSSQSMQNRSTRCGKESYEAALASEDKP